MKKGFLALFAICSFCHHAFAQSAWHTSIVPDPMTDNPTVLITLDSVSGTNSYGDPITLSIRCKNNTLSVIILWKQFVDDDLTPVMMRWGKTKPEINSYQVSSDGTASFIFDSGDDSHAIGKLLIENLQDYSSTTSEAGTGLAVEVEPYQSSPITAVFDLTGFSSAYKPVQKACGSSIE